MYVIFFTKYNSLVRPTREPNEDISALFSMLYTVADTEVKQDDIHNAKDEDDDNAVMADVDESKLGSCEDKSLWMRYLLMRRRSIWRMPRRNGCRWWLRVN